MKDDSISRQAAISIVKNRYSNMTWVNKAMLVEDLKDLPSAQSEPQWIPCSERLPKDRKSVIVCYRYWLQFSQKFAYAIVIGWRASKFGVKAEVFTDWDGDFDYNKEQDENYIPEGWYEFTTQGNGDLMDWYIDAEVIAWMPLPEPYVERRTNATN